MTAKVLRWPLSNALPKELHALKQFLVFKLRPKPNGKADKLPYYTNGKPRAGTQGTKADREKLVTLAEAEAAVKRLGMDGVGLALLADSPLVALDLDNCIDDSGPNALAREAAEWSYSEVSPSGRGLRVLMLDPLRTIKEDKLVTDQAEIFRANGFVTLTGNRVNSAKHLAQITEDMRARLGRDRFASAKPAAPINHGQKPISSSDGPPPTPAEAQAALDAYPNADVTWDEWNKVMLAIGHSMGASGKEVFREWSRQSPKHDDRVFEQEWSAWITRSRTRKARGAPTIGFGTLVHMGREAASRPKPARKPPAEAARTPDAEPEPQEESSGPGMAGAFNPFAEKIVPTKYMLDGCVAEVGAYLIAGKPKVGKSWFAIQLSVAAAWGGDFLGFRLQPTPVLYWDTGENGKNMMVERFGLCRERLGLAGPPKAELQVYAPAQGEETAREDAGIDELVRLIELYKPRMVVVDTLAGMLSRKTNDVYQGDYDRMRRLTNIAHHFGLALFVLIHDKKRSADDEIIEDKVTGSRGLTGAADGAIFIEAHHREVNGEVEKLASVQSSMRGARHDMDLGVQLVNGGFKLVGNTAYVRMSDGRLKVLRAFEIAAEDAGKDALELVLSSAQIGKLVGKSAAAARDICGRMKDSGELWSVPNVGWRLPKENEQRKPTGKF